MDRICDILLDVPLAVSRIALAVRQKKLVLDQVPDALSAIQPPSEFKDKIQAAIERSFGLIFSCLDPDERRMLVLVAAAPGVSVDRAWLENEAGGERTSTTLELMELLYANSPR